MHWTMTLFWIVYGLTGVFTLAWIIRESYRRWKRGSLFPPIGKDQILYRESFASGRSMKNTFTQFAGANNCLKLTVTPDELWITPVFPFGFFADVLDLEHRIPKKDIVTLHEEGGRLFGTRLTVEYRREDGQTKRILIVPSRYTPFKQALLTGTLVAIQ